MAFSWKELLAAAVIETDSARLPRRIDDARAAIMERIDKLLADPNRQPEHDEILDALNTLARLERELHE